MIDPSCREPFQPHEGVREHCGQVRVRQGGRGLEQQILEEVSLEKFTEGSIGPALRRVRWAPCTYREEVGVSERKGLSYSYHWSESVAQCIDREVRADCRDRPLLIPA